MAGQENYTPVVRLAENLTRRIVPPRPRGASRAAPGHEQGQGRSRALVDRGADTPARIDRLGEWLVCRGLITRGELFAALDACFRHNCRIGDALVWLSALGRRRLEREVKTFAEFRLDMIPTHRWTH